MIWYYLFSQQSFIEKLMKYKGVFIAVFIITSAMIVVLCQYFHQNSRIKNGEKEIDRYIPR